MQELVYTSASQGLAPGSSGFCTVAKTAGMSPILLTYLESRSGYRHIFPPQSEQAALNPVVWSHCVARFAQGQMGSKAYHILSRIADAGLDYTKRSNLIAHHLVFENNELPSCGPAALLAAPDVMLTQWSVPPHEIKTVRNLPNPLPQSLKCVHWEKQTQDAGWGGVLAESVIRSLSVYVLFNPGTQLLPLFAESLALLPESLRWKVTFCTYLQDFSTVSIFRWKGVLAGSPKAKQIREAKDTLILDLTNLPKTIPNDQTSFVKIARSGVEVPQVRQKVASPPESSQVEDFADSAPSRPGSIDVPAVREGTYGLMTSDMSEATQKRKRPKFGAWKKQYDAQSVAELKDRKTQQLFFTIVAFTSLMILILLTLLGDELLNSGGMRKGVLNAFSAMFQRSEQVQDLADAGKQAPAKVEQKNIDKGAADAEKPAEKPAENPDNVNPQSNADAKDAPEGFDLSAFGEKDDSALENPLTNETDEEEQRRLEEKRLEKEKLKKLLEGQQREEKERILQNEREEMRQAFEKIPEFFPLAEPTRRMFGVIKLVQNEEQTQFASAFPYRDYVKLEWIALAPPKGWTYRLDPVPSVFLDDPHIRWDLFAVPDDHPQSNKSIKLAFVDLCETGLIVQWNPKTAESEENFFLVNLLPFSFLRFTFGPNELTAKKLNEAKPGSVEPEDLERASPIPQDFEKSKPDLANIDFKNETWYKDISLWEPVQEKAYMISDKDNLRHPTQPEMEFDNVFGKSRFNNNLDLYDIQPSLVLEISTKPKEKENMLIHLQTSEDASETDTAWKKTMIFVTEMELARKTSPIPLTAIEIPLTVEATPTKIKIRDTSQDVQRDLSRERQRLKRIEKTALDNLAQLTPASLRKPGMDESELKKEFEQQKNKLQHEINKAESELVKIDRQWFLLPLARKKVVDAKISIHYSVFLKGENGTKNMLLLKTE